MERFTEDPYALLKDVPDTIDKLKWFYYDEVDKKRSQIAEFLIDLSKGENVDVRNSNLVNVD